MQAILTKVARNPAYANGAPANTWGTTRSGVRLERRGRRDDAMAPIEALSCDVARA